MLTTASLPFPPSSRRPSLPAVRLQGVSPPRVEEAARRRSQGRGPPANGVCSLSRGISLPPPSRLSLFFFFFLCVYPMPLFLSSASTLSVRSAKNVGDSLRHSPCFPSLPPSLLPSFPPSLSQVLTSREFKVAGAIGPCSSLKKMAPNVAETAIGEGGKEKGREGGKDKGSKSQSIGAS